VDYLFDRFSKLQTEPGYHPKWKEINLAAVVPGWKRFPAMQAKLVGAGLGADKKATVDTQTKRIAPGEKVGERRAQPQRQRAADAGLAEAAMALAGTFDAQELARLGVHSVQPDPKQARRWYERRSSSASAAALPIDGDATGVMGACVRVGARPRPRPERARSEAAELLPASTSPTASSGHS